MKAAPYLRRVALTALLCFAAANGQTFNPQLDEISRELQLLRHELAATRGPSTAQIERAARREWVVPRFGLGGELLNAGEIPPQFRTKVAASMGKSVDQVFAKQLAAERQSKARSDERVVALKARIAELESKLRRESAKKQ